MTSNPGSPERPLRVAVVGSGPSGFYTVAALFKAEDLAVQVDVFDRLPTPYGLVRGGVAPDHQKIKSVIRVYSKLAEEVGFRFFGNVELGTDIAVDELRDCYDQVVFAIGNESFRLMGVPGEDLDRVDSATEFVGWYNGHPDFSRLDFDLREVERVAVVGNGNVAMDVARVLVKDPDELAATDIADYALEALRASRVEEVLVLGRRGPAQASFTTKEIREIGSLPGVDLLVSPAQMELDPLSASWLEAEGSPGAKKNVEYLTGKSVEAPDGAPRRLHFEFLVSPIEFLGAAGGLSAVRLERNELYLDDRGTPRPRGTGETRVEQVQLALTAVGYRGVPLAGLPFDDDRGVLPNTAGRIQDDEGQALPGLYAVGWAKRGPTGLIGSNVADAEETVRSMTADLQAGRIRPATAPDPDEPARRLQSRGLRYVSFDDWRRLDDLEVEAGKGRGKIREKFTDVEAMLNALERA